MAEGDGDGEGEEGQGRSANLDVCSSSSEQLSFDPVVAHVDADASKEVWSGTRSFKSLSKSCIIM